MEIKPGLFERGLEYVARLYPTLKENDQQKQRFEEAVERVLQGRGLTFREKPESAFFYTPSPGFLEYNGGTSGARNEFRIYEGRNDQDALPIELNDILIAEFHNVSSHDVLIELQLGKLSPPKEGRKDIRGGIYTYEGNGSLVLDYGEQGRGVYGFENPWEKPNLRLTCDYEANISFIRFHQSSLGSGVLTGFFEDIGYTGLDRLVGRELIEK